MTFIKGHRQYLFVKDSNFSERTPKRLDTNKKIKIKITFWSNIIFCNPVTGRIGCSGGLDLARGPLVEDH